MKLNCYKKYNMTVDIYKTYKLAFQPWYEFTFGEIVGSLLIKYLKTEDRSMIIKNMTKAYSEPINI